MSCTRLLMLTLLSTPFALQADTFTPQQTLSPTIPGSPGLGDGFGQTVKMYDKWLFVGAPLASPDGKSNEGAIYIYRKKDNNWQNTQILTTNGSSDRLGDMQIEMHDKWLFVSAIGTPMGPIPNDVASEQDFTGAILVYRYDTAEKQWKFSQSIDRMTPGLSELTPISAGAVSNAPNTPLQTQQGASFGLRFSVDLKGKMMLAGAQFQQGIDASGNPQMNAGAVYALKLNEKGQWVFVQKITNPDGVATNDDFGANIALKGRFALISNAGLVNASRLNSNSFVYVYHLDNGQWNMLQKLSGDQPGPSTIVSPTLGTVTVGDAFGSALAIDDRWAIIGAALETREAGSPLSGAAYFYRLGKVNGVKQLTKVQKVVSDDPTAQGTGFLNVALQGETALISDPARSGPAGQAQGGVMVFKFKDGSWQQIHTLYDPKGQPFSFFGVGVSKYDNFYVGGDGTSIAGQFFSSVGNPVLLSPAPTAGDVVIFQRKAEAVQSQESSIKEPT